MTTFRADLGPTLYPQGLSDSSDSEKRPPAKKNKQSARQTSQEELQATRKWQQNSGMAQSSILHAQARQQAMSTAAATIGAESDLPAPIYKPGSTDLITREQAAVARNRDRTRLTPAVPMFRQLILQAQGTGSASIDLRAYARLENPPLSLEAVWSVMTREEKIALALPAINLHEHAGGAIPVEFVWEVMTDAEKEKYANSMDKLADDCAFKGSNLDEFMPHYTKVSRMIDFPTPDITRRAIQKYAEIAISRNQPYIELRLNPLQKSSVNPPPKNLSEAEISKEFVTAFAKGVEGANAQIHNPESPLFGKKPVECNLIFSALRFKHENDNALSVLNCAVAQRLEGMNVAGIDLAGGEAGHPVTGFKNYIHLTKAFNFLMDAVGTPEKQLGITIHGGETAISAKVDDVEPLDALGTVRAIMNLAGIRDVDVNIDSLARVPALATLVKDIASGKTAVRQDLETESLALIKELAHKLEQAEAAPAQDKQSVSFTSCMDSKVRIGHAILADLLSVRAELQEMKIYIEANQKSNLDISTIEKTDYFPLAELVDNMISAFPNTDNSTISDTNILEEYVRSGATLGQWHQMVNNAADAAFIFEPEKMAAMKDRIKEDFAPFKSALKDHGKPAAQPSIEYQLLQYDFGKRIDASKEQWHSSNLTHQFHKLMQALRRTDFARNIGSEKSRAEVLQNPTPEEVAQQKRMDDIAVSRSTAYRFGRENKLPSATRYNAQAMDNKIHDMIEARREREGYLDELPAENLMLASTKLDKPGQE